MEVCLIVCASHRKRSVGPLACEMPVLTQFVHSLLRNALSRILPPLPAARGGHLGVLSELVGPARAQQRQAGSALRLQPTSGAKPAETLPAYGAKPTIASIMAAHMFRVFHMFCHIYLFCMILQPASGAKPTIARMFLQPVPGAKLVHLPAFGAKPTITCVLLLPASGANPTTAPLDRM